MSKYVVYSDTSQNTSCNSVTDCYAAGKFKAKPVAAATTDAEKAKRCCLRQEFTKLPPASNVEGTGFVGGLKAGGFTSTVGEYTQICAYDDEFQKKLATMGATVDKATNAYTFPADYGGFILIMGCNGAARLVAVSTGVLAATLSLY